MLDFGGPTQTPANGTEEARMPANRRDDGEAVRREVLGEAYVAQRADMVTEFDQPFLDLILEGAWGNVWAGPTLTRRERSMITIALLAANGHWEEMAMHVRATANTGASPEDVREALLHVAVYSGVPAANQGFKVARNAFAEAGITV